MFYLLGVCKGLDQRFHYLLGMIPFSKVINKDSTNLDEIVIPGCTSDGFLLGSSIYLKGILAINQVKVVYTLLDSPILERMKENYHFKLVLLADEKYQEKLLLHKFNIVKYLAALKKIKLNKIGIYGNQALALKLKLPFLESADNYQVIINCDKKIFDKEKLSNKTIFDFVIFQSGFLNLCLKDENITFFAINQYLGQIMTKSGAKLIYDSLVRNRVNY